MPEAVQPGARDKAGVGILLSGRGSNFAALLRHERDGMFARARIACVVSNVPSAAGLALAREAGLPAVAIDPAAFPNRRAYEQEVVSALEAHGVEWVCLAGYMKIVGPTLLGRYPQRVLNIHPSLLPSFPGLHAQKQALEHGARVSGCTVHFVDAGMDTGPIIGQRAVPVMQDDTEDTLSERILREEHRLYAECLKRVTEEPWELRGRRVVFP